MRNIGHQTLQMTMRYAHLSPGYPTNEIQLLDGPAKPQNRAVTPDGTGCRFPRGALGPRRQPGPTMPWLACHGVPSIEYRIGRMTAQAPARTPHTRPWFLAAPVVSLERADARFDELDKVVEELERKEKVDGRKKSE